MNARRILAAFSLLGALVAPALAQSPYPPGPPPVVPQLPDSARQTTYTISGSTCACAISTGGNLAIYGSGTDFDAWIQVWVNGVRHLSTDPTFGWSLSSATGPLATIPRPITDAVLTFNNAQTGTVIIVGAERPRQTQQFNEGAGVSARSLNQRLTELSAIERELWDKTSDLSGRGLFFAPGTVVGPMPGAAGCVNAFLGFDSTGHNPQCSQFISAGSIATPGSTTPGDFACWNGTGGNSLADCPPSNGLSFQGRLTLASAVPVMGPTSCGGSSCASQGTVYYDCFNGHFVTYFSGTGDLGDLIPNCEVSTVLQTSGTGVINANDVFDVFWVHAGTNRICVPTNNAGAGWSGDTGGTVTARGTGYSQLNRLARGYLTNANIISHCFNGSTDYGPIAANQGSYLGTFATTSSAGKVSYVFGSGASGGGAAFFGVWNFYNRVDVTTNVADIGTSYTYATHTVRQARNSTGNEVQFVLGVAEDNVTVAYIAQVTTTAAGGAFGEIGVGFDVTNAFGCQPGLVLAATGNVSTGTPSPICAWLPSTGIHTIAALEEGDGTNANTFNATSAGNLSARLRM